MKYDDLSFEMINEEGIKVICDITTIIPNPDNSDEPYVIYTDYFFDEKGEFKKYYGKIVEENGQPLLQKIQDEKTIDMIIKLSKDEVVKYVNDQVQDNLN